MIRLLAAVSLISLGLVSAPALSAQSVGADQLTMNQWVESTSDGALTGRVVRTDADGQPTLLAGIDVALIAGDGKVLGATTDAEGLFAIRGVERGVYTLMARGQDVFACGAMQVIDAVDNAGGRFPKMAEINVANVDFTTVNMAMIQYLPPKTQTDGLSIDDANFAQLADLVLGVDSFQIARNKGGMTGRIHLAGPALKGAAATNVFILQDGMEVSRAITDSDGRFFVELDAGNYSLLAIGVGGVGLLGFDLVDVIDNSSRADAAVEGSSERLVVAKHGRSVCPQFAMQVAPAPEVIEVADDGSVQEGDEYGMLPLDDVAIDGFGSPVPGAGYAQGGGGSFGGGGGGAVGSGGGFGGIAALAGLAGVAAAASNDNGGGVIVASPSTPN